mgnify:CR=1 FL=1
MNETSTISPIEEPVTTLHQAADVWNGKLSDADSKLAEIQREIDDFQGFELPNGSQNRAKITPKRDFLKSAKLIKPSVFLMKFEAL